MWILIVILWAGTQADIGVYQFTTSEACESAEDWADEFFSDLYFEGPISTLCLHVDAPVQQRREP